MDDGLERAALCYLTTRGRVSGRSHTIEIWFAHHQRTIYMLSGGGDRSDWVRNLIHTPKVTVKVRRAEYQGMGRLVSDPEEDRRARDLVFAKYSRSYGGDLTGWREEALPVAVDLQMS